jgi:hypothetical protein
VALRQRTKPVAPKPELAAPGKYRSAFHRRVNHQTYRFFITTTAGRPLPAATAGILMGKTDLPVLMASNPSACRRVS